MLENAWKIKEIRQQIDVLNGESAPTMVIQNATYLHGLLKKWIQGNIWILDERIVYAGPEMPNNLKNVEIIDATGKKIVPGYIEPHVHPFQLYNPLTLADYAAQLGTTTFISDNLMLFTQMKNENAFKIMDQLKALPFMFCWWMRFDSQTELINESKYFNAANLKDWVARPDVIVGGELTAWPRLLDGDDQLLYGIQATKKAHLKIESHLPGASEKTLAKMKLFGVTGDHEAMTIEDVENRILHGYTVTLRNSSIREDLKALLCSILERDLTIFDQLLMTTDGSSPGFYEQGMMDRCIELALEAGVKPIDAYQMASYNVANYYDFADHLGLIATGRFATLNFLEDEYNPKPTDVLSKGVWLKRDGQKVRALGDIDWSSMPKLDLDFELDDDDFQFSMPFGLEMVNDVILKPYSINLHTNEGALSETHDECYLMLVDRQGKWRVNTLLKGFATHLQGFASSYSCTGDIILIGKNIAAMHQAFNEMKKLNGGIVLIEENNTISRLPLSLGGGLSVEPMEQLIAQERVIKEKLAAKGYRHGDAIYALLFLQSTHLPYTRITQRGIYDVMKKKVLFPSVMR